MPESFIYCLAERRVASGLPQTLLNVLRLSRHNQGLVSPGCVTRKGFERIAGVTVVCIDKG